MLGLHKIPLEEVNNRVQNALRAFMETFAHLPRRTLILRNGSTVLQYRAGGAWHNFGNTHIENWDRIFTTTNGREFPPYNENWFANVRYE